VCPTSIKITVIFFKSGKIPSCNNDRRKAQTFLFLFSPPQPSIKTIKCSEFLMVSLATIMFFPEDVVVLFFCRFIHNFKKVCLRNWRATFPVGITLIGMQLKPYRNILLRRNRWRYAADKILITSSVILTQFGLAIMKRANQLAVSYLLLPAVNLHEALSGKVLFPPQTLSRIYCTGSMCAKHCGCGNCYWTLNM